LGPRVKPEDDSYGPEDDNRVADSYGPEDDSKEG
jgi:hypothetical protein